MNDTMNRIGSRIARECAIAEACSPDWHRALEGAQLGSVSVTTAAELALDAPTPFLAGFLAGRLAARIERGEV